MIVVYCYIVPRIPFVFCGIRTKDKEPTMRWIDSRGGVDVCFDVDDSGLLLLGDVVTTAIFDLTVNKRLHDGMMALL